MNRTQRTWLCITAMGLLVFAVAAADVTLRADAQSQAPAEIWLVVDGTAIGTVKPGTFHYDLAASTLDVETNELVSGCSQDRIFRDRYEVRP